MSENPILFSASMVRAILDGTKTQTRRIVKPQPEPHDPNDRMKNYAGCAPARECYGPRLHGRFGAYFGWNFILSPYGKPGDRLWVKETWRTWRSLDHLSPKGIAPGAAIQYEADQWNQGFGLQDSGRIRQSIFMPRWASRIELEIVSVRVERLQDISEEDAIAESSYLDRCSCLPRKADKSPIDSMFQQHWCHIHGQEFRHLWKSINGEESWAANPWVWVVEFKRIGGSHV